MPSFYLHHGYRIIPFKDPSVKPYGAFANTTRLNAFLNVGEKEYGINQTVVIHGKTFTFYWPSSEHAYHAQKMLHLKQSYPADHPGQTVLNQMLQAVATKTDIPEFLPRKHFSPIITHFLPQLTTHFGIATEHAFNAAYRTKKDITEDFMECILKLKFEQHHDLKALVMDCARNNIIPVEVTSYDVFWGAGLSGAGKNRLGCLMLKIGFELLGLPNPSHADALYKEMQSEIGVNALSHDILEPLSRDLARWTNTLQAAPTTAPQVASARIQLYISKGGNQRLLIQNGSTIGYEWRENPSQGWKVGPKNRFTTLENAYLSNPPQIPVELFELGGNKRLLVQGNTIIDYEFRKNIKSLWQRSGDPGQFQYLTQQWQIQSAFKPASPTSSTPQPQISSASAPSAPIAQSPIANPIPPAANNYFESLDRLQRLVIQKPHTLVGYEYRMDINALWQNSNDQVVFQALIESWQLSLLKPLYHHASFSKSRHHFWHMASAEILAPKYQGLQGDILKTHILWDLTEKIEQCLDLEALKNLERDMKKLPEYQVLAKSQGFTSALFHIKTSSISALEQIFEEKRASFNPNLAPKP